MLLLIKIKGGMFFMKTMKKGLAILLTLIMALSVFSFAAITAGAEDVAPEATSEAAADDGGSSGFDLSDITGGLDLGGLDLSGVDLGNAGWLLGLVKLIFTIVMFFSKL